MKKNRHSAAFAGVGHSRVMRHDDVPLGILAIEACSEAISDAGLDMSQIDGVACVPAQPFDTDHAIYDGTHFVSCEFIIRALRINARWGGNVEKMLGRSLVEAINAVEAGICNYALVFRALHSPKSSYGHTSSSSASGSSQFEAPYGLFIPSMFAQMWHEYQDRFRAGSREQMATFVTQERRNGLLWEHGYWHQYHPKPLSVEEYLEARMVSTPLSIYDCDLPIQGCGAFIVTTAERALDLPRPPAYVRGVAATVFAKPQGIQPYSLGRQMESGQRIASDLWRDSGLGPNDIDVVELYDGFSIFSLLWLEAFGFCNEGEAFEFIQHGRIARDGELPVNPAGGSLGAGRMHGVTHVMDAILQVMGRAGSLQIPNAEVALAAVGPLSASSAFVLDNKRD